jgi:hypothetical protein
VRRILFLVSAFSLFLILSHEYRHKLNIYVFSIFSLLIFSYKLGTIVAIFQLYFSSYSYIIDGEIDLNIIRSGEVGIIVVDRNHDVRLKKWSNITEISRELERKKFLRLPKNSDDAPHSVPNVSASPPLELPKRGKFGDSALNSRSPTFPNSGDSAPNCSAAAGSFPAAAPSNWAHSHRNSARSALRLAAAPPPKFGSPWLLTQTAHTAAPAR